MAVVVPVCIFYSSSEARTVHRAHRDKGWLDLLCAPTQRQSLEHLRLELSSCSSSPLLHWNAIFANLEQLPSLCLEFTSELVSDGIIDALHGSTQLTLLSVLPRRNGFLAENGRAAMWPSCAAMESLLVARLQLRLRVLITYAKHEAEKAHLASGAANDPEQERQFRATMSYAALLTQFMQRVAHVWEEE